MNLNTTTQPQISTTVASSGVLLPGTRRKPDPLGVSRVTPVLAVLLLQECPLGIAEVQKFLEIISECAFCMIRDLVFTKFDCGFLMPWYRQ